MPIQPTGDSGDYGTSKAPGTQKVPQGSMQGIQKAVLMDRDPKMNQLREQAQDYTQLTPANQRRMDHDFNSMSTVVIRNPDGRIDSVRDWTLPKAMFQGRTKKRQRVTPRHFVPPRSHSPMGALRGKQVKGPKTAQEAAKKHTDKELQKFLTTQNTRTFDNKDVFKDMDSTQIEAMTILLNEAIERVGGDNKEALRKLTAELEDVANSITPANQGEMKERLQKIQAKLSAMEEALDRQGPLGSTVLVVIDTAALVMGKQLKDS